MNKTLASLVGAALLSTFSTTALAQVCDQCGGAPPPPPPPTTETIFIMQGYSGKPARSPAGQGTSAILTKGTGENVSLSGPGNSPHQAIHATKNFIP